MSTGYKNLSYTIYGFQDLYRCTKFLATHNLKPIFYPQNNYHGSNIIWFTWSGQQVEDYTTYRCLGHRQNSDHDIIINISQYVYVIIHTLLSVAVFSKVQIYPSVASNSTDGK